MRDAVRLIFEHTPEARTTLRIPVDESLVGYVLAEDVMAAGDTPSKPSTNVDGYAVRCESRHVIALILFASR